MKKLILIIISILALYFISWVIWGKKKLFEKEYGFLKKHEYYTTDAKKIFLINFDYNYSEGYGFYDSSYIAKETNKTIDTRMIDENSGNSFIVFKVSFYNPFFIKPTKSYWILGTDGVFNFSTTYSWFFYDWIQLSDTDLEF